MATFGSMKTWVQRRLQDPNGTAVSESEVADLINQAIDYWKNRRFWFNEITDTTTLSESDPSIPLPADFLVPSVNDCFVIEYSGIRYPLYKVSEIRYNELYLSNGIGQPYCFARLASDEYQVYPIPDRDYTLRRFYLRDYDALSNNSDTNDWTDYVPDMIQYTALAYGMRDIRQDLVMYREFNAEAQDEYQNALRSTQKQNATGRLEVSSALLY